MVKYILNILIFFSPMAASAAVYYVDSAKGLDKNTGTSASAPWNTLARVNSSSFVPGDSVCFLRGSVWIGQLLIKDSGTSSLPVVFTAYGKGPKPVIKNPGVNRAIAISVMADWVVVENFMVTDSHESGIDIIKGAEHNQVCNNEVTTSGIGIAVHGDHNLITRNYAHDLVMVVNNPGGDNDFGAVGIWLFSSNNEVSYNRMINCKAPSLDYGFDGGVVEFYGDVDSCYVHHNYGENCVGSFEVGGQGVTLTHNLIAYNIYVNNGGAGGYHVGGKFGVKFEDMRIENNVFIDTLQGDYSIGFWNGVPEPGEFVYINNIFYIPNYQRLSNNPGFIHKNNLYYLGGKTEIGIVPGPGDKICDPLLKDVSKNDFHLQAGSPAIDSALDLGFMIDFEGNTVPAGTAPDIGVYEYSNK
jgi:hypothetical protein